MCHKALVTVMMMTTCRICMEQGTIVKFPFIQQNTASSLRVAALDPGVRTFQTVFDASNECVVVEIGTGDLQRIYRLCKAADKLQSRCDAKHSVVVGVCQQQEHNESEKEAAGEAGVCFVEPQALSPASCASAHL